MGIQYANHKYYCCVIKKKKYLNEQPNLVSITPIYKINVVSASQKSICMECEFHIVIFTKTLESELHKTNQSSCSNSLLVLTPSSQKAPLAVLAALNSGPFFHRL